MTVWRDRAFAWLGVVLFTVSAVALSVAVIVQQIITNRNSSPTTASTQTAQPCTTDNNTETVLPAPEAYQPNGSVTSLQVTDLEAGTGATAKNGSCLIMKYYGTLAADGKLFDENFTKPTGLAFTLGQGRVIQGWDQGLVGMKVGGTRRLVIPSSLAYGSQSPSASIPANASLVFVVELLRIQ